MAISSAHTWPLAFLLNTVTSVASLAPLYFEKDDFLRFSEDKNEEEKVEEQAQVDEIAELKAKLVEQGMG